MVTDSSSGRSNSLPWQIPILTCVSTYRHTHTQLKIPPKRIRLLCFHGLSLRRPVGLVVVIEDSGAHSLTHFPSEVVLGVRIIMYICLAMDLPWSQKWFPRARLIDCAENVLTCSFPKCRKPSWIICGMGIRILPCICALPYKEKKYPLQYDLKQEKTEVPVSDSTSVCMRSGASKDMYSQPSRGLLPERGAWSR